MSDRLENQLSMIRYFRIIQLSKGNRDVGLDEATNKYIAQGYASKYDSVWYDGIPRDELKEKLFGNSVTPYIVKTEK